LWIAGELVNLGERSIVPELMWLLSDEQVDSNVRWSIVRALGKLGERSIAPELMRLLGDKQFDSVMRMDIVGALGELGERSIAPELMRLLRDKQLDSVVRKGIAAALRKLIDDITLVLELASLLDTSDIPEPIYSALWTISQCMNIQVYKLDTGTYKIVHLDEQS
jgi:HEAT repeat protein